MSQPLAPSPDLPDVQLVVERIDTPGTDIREITLRAPDGGALPGYTPGAHVRVAVPGGRNAYSLIDLGEGCAAPTAYRLGVRRDAGGAGGSVWMHGLKPGDAVTASAPRNDFPLDDGAAPALLLAGGIGVTPLISMAEALAGTPRDWHLHYAARSAGAAAFSAHLTARHGARVSLHHDDSAGAPLPVAALVAAAAPGTHVYVCGPKPMIEATRRACESAGIPADHIHTELFDAPAPQAGDRPFEVEISSGAVFTIPPGRTIIEVLEENSVDLVYDCQRGDCGICQVDVLEGTPDHRDVVLSDAERASGKVMQICVSRALSPRLKLAI